MRLQDLHGCWALVTGASSGIGQEYCRQIAAAGVNLVLVARRTPLLQQLSDALISSHSIRTLVLTADLSQPDSASKLRFLTRQSGIRIRLLVNNAAFDPWGSFEKTSAVDYERLVGVAVTTPISLCRLYFDDLASFPSSAVINISSPAALQPVPYKAVYSAAKSCLHNFSLALFGEWASRGIHVQTVLPGPTQSEIEEKGAAYKSALSDERRPASEIVGKSLDLLASKDPVVTNSKGIYKQRLFAGIAPVKMVIREVKKMFEPPPGR